MPLIKTHKLSLSIFLLLITNLVLAANYSFTFDKQVWHGWSTQNLNGVNWSLSGTNATYFGFDTNKGQQFGSANNPNEWVSLKTLDIPGNITSIRIHASGANDVQADLNVQVGGIDFSPTSFPLSSANQAFEFSGFSSGELKVNIINSSAKALYIRRIEVEYSQIILPRVIIEEISLDFESEIDASGKKKIEVEARNLNSDIRIELSGEHKEKFDYYCADNFDLRNGGVIFISYSPDSDEDVHQANLTLSSEGAVPRIFELTGRAGYISILDNPLVDSGIWTEKNTINFYADKGESVDLYNIDGQKVLQTTAIKGLNVIHIQAKGILIIKIGNKINKILL